MTLSSETSAPLSATSSRGANPLAVLMAPLNVAAYVAWLAILIDVVGQSFAWPGGVALMALVLLAFVGGLLLRAQGRAALAWVAFGLQVLATLLLLDLGRTNTTPVLLIIAAVVAALNALRVALIAIMVGLNLALAAVVVFRWHWRDPWSMLLVLGGFQLFAIVTVQAMRRATEAAEELRRVNADLLATRTLLAQGVRESERLRLSRELHDVAGHTLTALKLNLAAAEQSSATPGQASLHQAAGLASQLLADIRAVVAQLRQHDGIDLHDLLHALVDRWPGPRVHLDLPEALRIRDLTCADTLLRVTQEGLTNATRHATARQVWVTLRHEGDRWLLHIDDDGHGARDLTPGLGLTGMRERVEALGGQLQIASSPRGGLRLTASIPQAAGA